MDGPTAEATSALSISGTSGAGALALGAERIGGNENFEGDIARIMIFDRALSEGEIDTVGSELSGLYDIEGTFSRVPEVSSALLMGLAGLMGALNRRRK